MPAKKAKTTSAGAGGTDSAPAGAGAAGTSTYGQGNISAVSVLAPDLEKYPLFANAAFTDTVLGPGDSLFIPRGWWHFVMGLTTSASINFNF